MVIPTLDHETITILRTPTPKQARHPAIRRADDQLTGENPPTNWFEFEAFPLFTVLKICLPLASLNVDLFSLYRCGTGFLVRTRQIEPVPTCASMRQLKITLLGVFVYEMGTEITRHALCIFMLSLSTPQLLLQGSR